MVTLQPWFCRMIAAMALALSAGFASPAAAQEGAPLPAAPAAPTTPAAPQAGDGPAVVIEPNVARIDVSAAVYPFEPDQPVVEAARGRTHGWFYVDVVNQAATPQTRILRFIDPAPGRLTWLGGVAQHRLEDVHALTGPEGPLTVTRVRGFAHPAARVELPPGERVTIAFEVSDPSAEAGLEIWTEAAFVRSERAMLLRTTLFGGVLLAAAAYLFALAVTGAGAALWYAGGAVLAGLVALLAQEGMLGDTPIWAGATAEGVAAAGAAAAAALGLLYLRAAMRRGQRRTRFETPAHALAAGLALAGLAALACAPGARAVSGALVLVAIAFALVWIWLARRSRAATAVRHTPAAVALGLAALVGLLNIVALGGGSLEADVAASGAFTIGLALLAFAAGPATGRPAGAPAVPETVSGPGPGSEPVPRTAAASRQGCAAERRYALALAASYQGVFDWDIPDDALTVTEAVERLLGLAPGELNGSERLWAGRIHPEDREVYEHAIEAYRAQGNASFTLELRLAHADGGYRWLQLRASCLADGSGAAARCIGTVSDVSLRKVQEARLVEDALKDPLTGLASRAILLDRLQRLVDGKRQGAPERAALVVFDLDRFRTINEGLGPMAGDLVILALARRLDEMALKGLEPARIGSDEFAVLIDGPAADQADMHAEALRRLVGEPIDLEGRDLSVTASVGLVHVRADHVAAEDVLRDAEVAMFHAKTHGGDRVERFAAQLTGRATERLSMEADLRRALARDEMEVHFQPVVALKDGRLVGFEALLRWNRGIAGVVPADGFIALAEETGVILDLGRFAVERAAAELRAWHALSGEGPQHLFVAVNISARELLRPQFAEAMIDTLRKLDLPRGALKFEITESTMMSNPEAALATLTALKDMGAGLALDDFGTGFSSLSYLHRYPFDLIKIDKTFVDALSRKDDARAIVKTIVALAHELGLKVVAEGVESEEMARRLLKLKCDWGQGLHFAGAMTADEARLRVARELAAAEG